jgi:hypothetical protein
MSTKDEEEDELVVIRAPLGPLYGGSFEPQLPEPRPVEICLFSFGSWDKKCQLQN